MEPWVIALIIAAIVVLGIVAKITLPREIEARPPSACSHVRTRYG